MKNKDFNEAKPGDIVRCNYNFDQEREIYKLKYPHKGDYLTVKEALIDRLSQDHHLCYFFEEIRLPIPLVAGRFDLVQIMSDGDLVLNEAYKLANNI